MACDRGRVLKTIYSRDILESAALKIYFETLKIPNTITVQVLDVWHDVENGPKESFSKFLWLTFDASAHYLPCERMGNLFTAQTPLLYDVFP